MCCLDGVLRSNFPCTFSLELHSVGWKKNATFGLCPENNVRLWSHDLDLTTDQRFGHLLSSN